MSYLGSQLIVIPILSGSASAYLDTASISISSLYYVQGGDTVLYTPRSISSIHSCYSGLVYIQPSMEYLGHLLDPRMTRVDDRLTHTTIWMYGGDGEFEF